MNSNAAAKFTHCSSRITHGSRDVTRGNSSSPSRCDKALVFLGSLTLILFTSLYSWGNASMWPNKTTLLHDIRFPLCSVRAQKPLQEEKTKRIAASRCVITIAYCGVLAARDLEVCLGALPEKRQTADLGGKAGMIIPAMPPAETEPIWQKQSFDSTVNLWFRDCLSSSHW